MLAFTDEQLAQIRAAAAPVPWSLREAYLERIATLLSGWQFSNGDVQRQVQRELDGAGAARAHRGRDYRITHPDRFLARVDNELAVGEGGWQAVIIPSR